MISEIQNLELKIIKEINDIAVSFDLKYSLAYGSVLGSVRHKGFIPWDTDIDIMVSSDEYDNFCKVIKTNLSSDFEIKYYKHDKTYSSFKARVYIKNGVNENVHVDIFPLASTRNNGFISNIKRFFLYVVYRLYFIKKVERSAVDNYSKMKKIQFLSIRMLLLFIPSFLLIKIFERYNKSFNNHDYFFNICGSYGKREFIIKEFYLNTVLANFENLQLPIPKDYHLYLNQMYGDYMTPKKNN